MRDLITPESAKFLKVLTEFLNANVKPNAGQYDREQLMPPTLLKQLAQLGCLRLNIPKALGGLEYSPLILGKMIEAIATTSGSLASMVIVHLMVCEALLRWGTQEQHKVWIPRLGTGEIYAAFALSEPDAGSDISSITTQLRKNEKDYSISGTKQWISGAQYADLFLSFGYHQDQAVACILQRGQANIKVEPIQGMMGFRAAMLGKVIFSGAEVQETMLIGRIGAGISHVATTALDLGRYLMGWLSLGLAKVCIERSQTYVNQRYQFKELLKEHQLIKKRLTQMIVQYRAAQQLCLRVAQLREAKEPEGIIETSIAKYFSADMVQQVSAHAMHIHGANGLHESSDLHRYVNDAKVLAIIEGSSEIQEILIADYASRGALML